MFLFDNIKEFRDEIARPSQDVPWGVMSQTDGKIQVRNFKGIRKLALKLSYKIWAQLNRFRNYSVSIEDRFSLILYTLLLVTQYPLSVFKIWLFHMKVRDRFYQNHYRNYLKITFLGFITTKFIYINIYKRFIYV